MELAISSKKIMLATILTSGIALAISQAALAEPAQPGVQVKKGLPPCQSQMDPAALKAHEKFLTETVDIRKKLAEKNAAMRALLNAGTPDTDKASLLAGELFDLREKLRVKAQEAGMPMMMMGLGDMSNMPCQGMGDGMENRHHRKN